MRALAVLLFVLSGLLSQSGHADEPVGTWRWHQDDRPVKVVFLGGSIGAWPSGSFAQYLEAACSKIEIRNLSKTGYGALQLRQRYRAQVLKNPGGKPREGQEHWLVHSGGLNSIGSPSITITETMNAIVAAHRAGAKVVGLSLTPWGKEAERRWKEFAGIASRKKTESSADYLQGRLNRAEALGAFVESERRGDPNWLPEELPDVAVNLYDSELRDKSAALRDTEKLGKLWDRNRKLQAQYPDRAAAVVAAAEIPRWYLRPELHSFDHIHPNGPGHKLMATLVCPSMPATWGCNCATIPGLEWVKGHVAPAPAVATPPSQ